MYCANCGRQVGETAQFCPHCGVPLGYRTDRSFSLTFVEGERILAGVTVTTERDRTLTFGRERDNDIVVDSPSKTVSAHHGHFEVQGSRLFVVDDHSTNGLYYNGTRQTRKPLALGDVLTVGRPKRGERRTVIVVGEGDKRWNMHALDARQTLTIGRLPENDLTLPDPTVSARHARLDRDARGDWAITDLGSSNGTRVNGSFVAGTAPLVAGSVIFLGNSQLVFLDTCLLALSERQGVEVTASNLVRYRTNRGVRRITTDHISLHIGRGEFVAIVGGSGCGKSTLLNEINGSEPADEGAVQLDGTDLYANYEMLKSSIGYVPQQDIVFDGLRLQDMLAYAAKLRMQPDTTPAERAARVEEVIDLLELQGVRENFIGKLSGGQKKRASIAVELLADPRLLFLDEPTSGLDPGIERKLMQRLAEMAHEGRTIILVTHTTLNLHLCDQVVFLGAGGKLCYAGEPHGALAFFGVTDFVEVYPLIDTQPAEWEEQFKRSGIRERMRDTGGAGQKGGIGGRRTPHFLSQLVTLSARYARLLLNDWPRLLLMIGQAPLLAYLIKVVAGEGVFTVCEDTKFCLFAISCAAFWVGIFDSIQEICKENSVFRREYEGGMRLPAYVFSKVIVLGVLCLVQTALLVAVIMLTMGTPQNELISGPLELMVSTYLTVLSAMCLGLFVSALFHSPDAALAMAPLLIMPQILFSGIAFELNDVTDKISYAINCRWAIEALGTTADLNDLDLAIYGEEIVIPEDPDYTLEKPTIDLPDMTQEVEVETPMGTEKQEVTIDAHEHKFDEDLHVEIPEMTKTIDDEMFEHEVDEMFDHTVKHLLTSWGILLGFSLATIIGCFIALAFQVRR
ncbi:MAG: ATP-binding cassette domain-containing protein [Atopobiaceae bacterium]|nr:ATP-binding cassette domain-containing protein [Atopobiaceae bacterium]MBR3313338.1 ATP-binding cassette domain-containing protein [Atopobiaceae bacterium]